VTVAELREKLSRAPEKYPVCVEDVTRGEGLPHGVSIMRVFVDDKRDDEPAVVILSTFPDDHGKQA